MSSNVANYCPGGYYFRKAYREAGSDAERAEIFETLLLDHEQLREWCRQRGWIPPKFLVVDLEAEKKPQLFNPFPGSQLDLGLPHPVVPDCPGQLLFFSVSDAMPPAPPSAG